MRSKRVKEIHTITHQQASEKDNNNLFHLTEQQFNNNIRMIKEINEKINNCKNLTSTELNECLIYVYDLLMHIPYKYGRVNLEKCSTGTIQINKYITHIGFPYLVKELRENEDIKISTEVLDEIVSIFPKALNRFLFYQYQEPYLNEMGDFITLPQKLLQDIHKQQYEIEKIQALQYTPEQKEKLLNEIKEISNDISSLENEMNQLQQIMKSPEIVQQEIVAIEKDISTFKEEKDNCLTKKMNWELN